MSTIEVDQFSIMAGTPNTKQYHCSPSVIITGAKLTDIPCNSIFIPQTLSIKYGPWVLGFDAAAEDCYNEATSNVMSLNNVKDFAFGLQMDDTKITKSFAFVQDTLRRGGEYLNSTITTIWAAIPDSIYRVISDPVISSVYSKAIELDYMFRSNIPEYWLMKSGAIDKNVATYNTSSIIDDEILSELPFTTLFQYAGMLRFSGADDAAKKVMKLAYRKVESYTGMLL